MPSQAVIFVTAVCFLFLVAIAVILSPDTAANAAAGCLSGPSKTTPPGGHWYYRIDRITKRHCWYLGEEGTPINKTARLRPARTPAAQDDSQSPPLAPSVANAHAEWPITTNVASATPVAPVPAEASIGAYARSSSDEPRYLTTDDLMRPQTLASRWPAPNEFEPTPSSTISRDTAPIELIERQPAPIKAETNVGALQIFLSAFAIVLALAAVLGRVVFRYFTARRPHDARRSGRRNIWPDDIPEGSVRPSYAQIITPERRARSLNQPTDLTDEIEHLLRTASRRLR